MCIIDRIWLSIHPSKPSFQNCTYIKIIQFEEISDQRLYSHFVLTTPFLIDLSIGLHCLTLVLNKTDYKNQKRDSRVQLVLYPSIQLDLVPLVICEVFPAYNLQSSNKWTLRSADILEEALCAAFSFILDDQGIYFLYSIKRNSLQIWQIWTKVSHQWPSFL